MAKVVLPELYFFKTYTVGYARQLLRFSREAEITSTEKIQLGPRSTENCWVLDDGERLIVTKKPKLDKPDGIDGILRRFDDGQYKWLSHRLLDDARKQIGLNGLRVRSEVTAKNWPKAFHYKAQAFDDNGNPIPGDSGLRPPQLGALFAIGSHWSLYRHPATIVMPTGTGKTETMLCTLAALPQGTMLVAVPSKALRKQTFHKFVTFGLLRNLGLLRGEIENPVVGILAHQPKRKKIWQFLMSVMLLLPLLSRLVAIKPEHLQMRLPRGVEFLL